MPRHTGGRRSRAREERDSRAASGRDGREPIEGSPRSKSEGPGGLGEATGSPEAAVSTGVLAPGLYIVATPIGNLGDITLRALEVLRGVDLIACEDTRVTATLARRFELTADRLPYHDHNAETMRPKLLARLQAGASVALVSDAGTPLVSDPGLKLVQAAIEAGIPVTAIPGASAMLAALMVAGLPTDRFLFAGFLPAKQGQRRQALGELARVPASLVFFETAPRLAEALADMASVLGDRPAAVARELTKIHEEVRRGSLAGLATHYGAGEPPRGEIVLVVGPPAADVQEISPEALDARIGDALQTQSVRAASAAVAAETGLPRRQVYARALALAGKRAP